MDLDFNLVWLGQDTITEALHSGKDFLLRNPIASLDESTWHISEMAFKVSEQPDDGDYIKLDIYASQLINGQSKNKCLELKDIMFSALLTSRILYVHVDSKWEIVALTTTT